MQKLVLALALGTAAGYVAPPSAARAPLAGAKEDLMQLQEELAGPPGFWDPLNLASQNYALGNVDAPVGEAATIGFLRHAEIKHGRVAMAAFLGFIAQSTPLVSGEHTFAPYRGYVAGCTPQEQWDNIPLLAKLQIFVAIGMLESYGEGAGAGAEYTHYMNGGVPGFYPEIKGKGAGGQITFNLYDPFGFGFRDKPEAKRARGRKSEILNGRAAMFGILGFLSESQLPGSVPVLSKISGFPHYAGDIMAPFSNDFSLLH